MESLGNRICHKQEKIAEIQSMQFHGEATQQDLDEMMRLQLELETDLRLQAENDFPRPNLQVRKIFKSNFKSIIRGKLRNEQLKSEQHCHIIYT